jgi:hypothetical protein
MNKSKCEHKLLGFSPRQTPNIVSCRFVDRYIPGYHFFGAGVVAGGYDEQTGSALTPPWMQDEKPNLLSIARCLRVNIDDSRRMKWVEYCRRSGSGT